MTPTTEQKAIVSSDKSIINGVGDINQLMPFKYNWAWEFFLKANNNHWTPLDINMAGDILDHEHNLTDVERHVYDNVLASLSTSDILAMRNIALAVMEKMTAPELQVYQARQIYEEALHSWSYSHCIESIGLDQEEIYNRYRTVPEINAKIQHTNSMLDKVMARDFELDTPENIKMFVMGYIFFAAIFEGTWFYNGFTPIFAMQRNDKMKATAEQLQYIMRDEVLHASFGIRVIKTLLLENPDIVISQSEINEMFTKARDLEADYAGFILRDPIPGYTKEIHIAGSEFIMNRRARQLGFDNVFPITENPIPWLDEQANLSKEKNFFETRVTEYQSGGSLDWD